MTLTNAEFIAFWRNDIPIIKTPSPVGLQMILGALTQALDRLEAAEKARFAAESDYQNSKFSRELLLAELDAARACITGLEAAGKEQPQWIPCSEMLPDYYNKVWIWCPLSRGKPMLAQRVPAYAPNNSWGIWIWEGFNGQYRPEHVACWVPIDIPAPPEEA